MDCNKAFEEFIGMPNGKQLQTHHVNQNGAQEKGLIYARMNAIFFKPHRTHR